MIITKETGTIYTNGLVQEVIDWHKRNNKTIAIVTRPLTYEQKPLPTKKFSKEFMSGGKEQTSRFYIDDITVEEVEAGKNAVKSFLYQTYTDGMYFKVQRGEMQEKEWLDAINKIKAEWL